MDAKITALDANTTPASTDLTVIVDDPGGTPATQKMTLDTLDDYLSASTKTLTNKTLTSPVIQAYGGYMPIGHTCTYASSDDPTYTFTIASFDATTLFSPGMKIKLTDSGTQYFFVTKVVFDDPGSTITVYGGTDYNLSTGAITNPYYSTQKAPLDFPLDPAKWTETFTDTTQRIQANPTVDVWYNLGSLSIDIPLGSWDVFYFVLERNSTAAIISATLSTADNTESDSEFTTYINSGAQARVSQMRRKILTLAAKDTYYMNARCNLDTGTILWDNHIVPLLVKAICAYL